MKQFTTSEITEGLDLLGDWLAAKGYTEEAGLCTRAMDEINRLQKALKPFAELAQHTGSMSDMDGVCVYVADLRAARAAMGESDE